MAAFALCSGVGDAEPFNLLVEGPVVRFYKLTTGNVQSRQATAGIIIPTAYGYPGGYYLVPGWYYVVRSTRLFSGTMVLLSVNKVSAVRLS